VMVSRRLASSHGCWSQGSEIRTESSESHRNSSISAQPEINVNRPKYFGPIQIYNSFDGPVNSPITFPTDTMLKTYSSVSASLQAAPPPSAWSRAAPPPSASELPQPPREPHGVSRCLSSHLGYAPQCCPHVLEAPRRPPPCRHRLCCIVATIFPTCRHHRVAPPNPPPVHSTPTSYASSPCPLQSSTILAIFV
jgi:hypothetical protein